MADADFSQLEKFFADFKDAKEDFADFLDGFLLEMAQRAIAKIKPETPWRTGDLRNSWYIKDTAISGSDLHVTIANDQNYASFVEYGHRHWKSNTWVDGFFMMTIGIDEVQKQMPARFQKAFREYMQSKGVG